MEHVVFYPAADGSPAFRRVASMEEAVRYVEHLRNIDNVSEFSVHQLTQVPLSFRTYYRVELPSELDPLTAPVAPAAEVDVPAVAPVSEVPAVEAVAVEEPVAQEAAVEVASEPEAVADAPAEPSEEAPAEQAPADAEAVASVPAPSEPVAEESLEDSRKSLGFFAR